jgi:hypothetical protein
MMKTKILNKSGKKSTEKFHRLKKVSSIKNFRLLVILILISGLLIYSLLEHSNQAHAQGSKADGKTATNEKVREDDGIFEKKDFTDKTEKTIAKERIYEEIILEDFETNVYGPRNLKFSSDDIAGKHAAIAIREDYPAPILNSKKYLGIKVYGLLHDAVSVYPPKPIQIDKYCKEISIWVYGKGLSGSFYLIMQDVTGNTHRLSFGQLNFLGWRRLSISMDNSIKQSASLLKRNNYMQIIALVFNPGNSDEQKWNYVYFDDLTASVRGKYGDHQSDSW